MQATEAVLAAIAVGSNLDGPTLQVMRAFDELADLPRTRRIACSPLYRSKAVGLDGQMVHQPDFCNAAVLLETRLDPFELMNALQTLEHAQGRVRRTRNAARSLDLDLLVYGNRVIDVPNLMVPHPRMASRNFVLYPLRDIAADLAIPGLGCVHELAARLDSSGLQAWQD